MANNKSSGVKEISYLLIIITVIIIVVSAIALPSLNFDIFSMFDTYILFLPIFFSFVFLIFLRLGREDLTEETKRSFAVEQLKNKIKKRDDVLKKLKEEIKRKEGEIKEMKEGEKEINFLITTQTEKTYSKKIEELIEKAEKEILILSPYLNGRFLHNLKIANQKGCKIKILMKYSKDSHKRIKDAKETLREYKIADVRVNNSLHGRMLIADGKELILGSGDLDSNSMDNNKECGIWTNNSIIVKEAIDCFKKFWK